MNGKDMMKAWKEQRGKIEVNDDFADRVMIQITAREQTKNKFRFDINKIFMRLSAYRPVRASLIAAGALIGLARLIIMIRVTFG